MTPSGSDDNQRRQKLRQHYKETYWAYWLLIILGVWAVLSPLIFSYGVSTVEPAGGREVWLPLDTRIGIMTWNTIMSGLILILFGWRSLTPNRPASLWICCFTGIWLNLAPVLFWAPTAIAYFNSVGIGVLVIALSVIIPGIPNSTLYRKEGAERPPGWSYNPSSVPQRSILILVAFVGWMFSLYLGSYQLGYVDTAWDPFFGDGTRQVLESDLSETWPVSDGALGAVAYTLEFLMAWMGGTARWRTMPWLIAFFGILVVPLGLVHIFLIISQPVIVGAWCTLCLGGAVMALLMIVFTIDEVGAAAQHLLRARRRGTLWSAFWKGDEPEEDNRDERSPEMVDFPSRPGAVLSSSTRGASFPPMLTGSALVGLWLMFAPAQFGLQTQDTAANVSHLAGALIVIISVISMAELLRKVRYLNLIPALAVAVIPWFLADGGEMYYLNGTFAALFVILLSLPRGEITDRYGIWDRYIQKG